MKINTDDYITVFIRHQLELKHNLAVADIFDFALNSAEAISANARLEAGLPVSEHSKQRSARLYQLAEYYGIEFGKPTLTWILTNLNFADGLYENESGQMAIKTGCNVNLLVSNHGI